jgi:hypothetical protein
MLRLPGAFNQQRFTYRQTNRLYIPSNNIFLTQPPVVRSSSFFWGNEADTKESDIRVLEGEDGGGGQHRRGSSSGDEKISRLEAPSTGIHRPCS